MQRVKLNDKFEFPLMLDMALYLSTFLNLQKEGGGGELTPTVDSQHMYRLSGIIVHSGTADSGHYYSYISD
jgi:ubiquitin C-terminal hydrolase